MEGWIKIHRKVLNSDMYQSLDSRQRDVMLTCLLLANHTEKRWEWKGQVFICRPGQFISSLDVIKRKCGPDATIRGVRTALEKLKKWNFLTDETTSTGRLITICKWDTYQVNAKSNDTVSDKALTNGRQSSDKRPTTTKNVKKDKEGEEGSNLMEISENFEEKIISNEPLAPEDNPRFKSYPIDAEYRIAYSENRVTPELEARWRESIKQRGL